VQDIVTEPEYLDVAVPSKTVFRYPVKGRRTVFAYIIDGAGHFDSSRERLLGPENLVLLGDGDEVLVTTEDKSVRFLLISGKPIGEPVFWYGPIVMNAQEELRIAFEEYQNGTFLKHGKIKQ
jgi:redox-sensitive bicupin YhaK (pirin superfamily)